MEKNENNNRNENTEMNRTHDNRASHEGLEGKISQEPINQDELDSFPPEKKNPNPDIEAERESHLVNKRTPVREGRNIISTDNNPDRDGFM